MTVSRREIFMRLRMLIAVVLSFVAAGLLAGSAQATVVDKDDVKLTSAGYDFGSYSSIAGNPTGAGTLRWRHEDSSIRPDLEGYIHMDDSDGTCARIAMTYYNDGEVLETKFSGSLCADDDRHHLTNVNLQRYSDDRIDAVVVALQRETAFTPWMTIESAVYELNTWTDRPKITEDGVDFGESGFAFGEPTASGWASWFIGEDAKVEPWVSGAIHLNNSSGVCARINVVYRTDGGTVLSEDASGRHCAPDNDHHDWWINVRDFRSDKIGQVRIQLQTQASDGSWQTAGSEIASLAM
jgi:hypothetical protein